MVRCRFDNGSIICQGTHANTWQLLVLTKASRPQIQGGRANTGAGLSVAVGVFVVTWQEAVAEVWSTPFCNICALGIIFGH